MTNSILGKALCAAAAVAITATSFGATAGAQSRITRSAEVRYGDLDLTSVAGKATLDDRLKGAVSKVCGGFNQRHLKEMQDHRQCVDEANLSAKRATVTIMAAADAGTLAGTSVTIGN